MAPDLNSLPSTPPPANTSAQGMRARRASISLPDGASASPHSHIPSLAAAASLNRASHSHEQSQGHSPTLTASSSQTGFSSRPGPGPRSGSLGYGSWSGSASESDGRRESGATGLAGDAASPPPSGASIGHRRASLAQNLALADPDMPPPQEVAQCDRRPSLGGHGGLAAAMAEVSGDGRGSRGMGADVDMGTADPNHRRTPSVGEMHQKLEQEQEAQVVSLASFAAPSGFIYQGVH